MLLPKQDPGPSVWCNPGSQQQKKDRQEAGKNLNCLAMRRTSEVTSFAACLAVKAIHISAPAPPTHQVEEIR